MIFKDREEGGKQLAEVIKQDKELEIDKNTLVVASLLRGGALVGEVIARELGVPHIPLVVVKISSPLNPELAIGAVCDDVVYLEKKVIDTLQLVKPLISHQINKAKEKYFSYTERFHINQQPVVAALQSHNCIIVDDGLATGASARTALLYVKSKGAQKVYLAIPVSPTAFDNKGFDKLYILHQDQQFSSVSQFYEDFPQVSDEEVRRVFAMIS